MKPAEYPIIADYHYVKQDDEGKQWHVFTGKVGGMFVTDEEGRALVIYKDQAYLGPICKDYKVNPGTFLLYLPFDETIVGRRP